MTAISLPNDQTATDRPVFDDALGNVTAAPAGAVLTFSAGNAALATLTVAADGLSATITPVGPAGAYTYSVAATDSAGTPITGYSQELDIVAGAAVALAPGLSFAPKAA